MTLRDLLPLFILFWVACQPSNAQSGFIRQSGRHLYQGASASPYYFKGITAPSLPSDFVRYPDARSTVDSLHKYGIDNIRFLQPPDTVIATLPMDTLLMGYDLLLDAMSRNHLKGVLAVRDTTFAALLVDRVNRVNGRLYARDSTIMAWQVQLPSNISDSTSQAQIIREVRNFSSWLKRRAPLQLVSLSGWIPDRGILDENQAYHLYVSDSIDYIALQLLPLTWHWASPSSLYDALQHVYLNTQTMLETTDRLSHKLNKPVVMDEISYPRDNFLTDASSSVRNRDRVFSFILGLLKESCMNRGSLAGCNFSYWLTSPDHATSSDDQARKGSPSIFPLEYIHSAIYGTDESTKALFLTPLHDGER